MTLKQTLRDTAAAEERLKRATAQNGGNPLSAEQRERIGLRPKGVRSSTGRKHWPGVRD